jgi:hypothetical protein
MSTETIAAEIVDSTDVEVISDQSNATGPDALGEMTPVQSANLAKNDTAIDNLVELARATLDPRDQLKKYCKLGKAALAHAVWQKNNFAGTYTREDFDRLCERIADRVKLTVPIASVRIDDYIRMHVFVEAVKPMVENVDTLSIYQVSSKFLPMLSFSKTELTGELRLEWTDFVKKWVSFQVSSEPVSMRVLDAAIADCKVAIESARDSKKTQEQRDASARGKIVAAKVKAENDLNAKLTTGIDEALGGILTPEAVVGILEKVALDRNVTLPNRVKDLGRMSVQEANLLAKTLFEAGNAAAIKTLYATLGKMVATIDAAAVQAKAAA